MRVTISHLVTCGDGDGVRTRIVLAPDGQVESTSGNFVVDAESGRLVAEAFEAHGADLPIDYEHQSLGGEYSSPDGRAPAAGWIKAVHYETGVGIIGEVEWTNAARGMLTRREYRYLSPVAIIRKTDRKLVGLHSAALTNKPAIRRMEAIAAKDHTAKEPETMGTKTTKVVNQEVPPEDGAEMIEALIGGMCAKVGIPIEGSIVDMLKAIDAKLDSKDGDDEEAPSEEASKLRTVLQVPKDAPVETLVAKINELKGHVGYVKADEYAAVKQRVEALEQANKMQQAAEIVIAYVEAGKLNPDDADRMKWANEMAVAQPEAFKTLMDGAPDIRPPQGMSMPPKGITVPGGRTTIIANAARDFDGQSAAYQALATKRELVNHALVTNKLKPLTEEEAERIGC